MNSLTLLALTDCQPSDESNIDVFNLHAYAAQIDFIAEIEKALAEQKQLLIEMDTIWEEFK